MSLNYIPQFYINSAGVVRGPLFPPSSDGAALGSAASMWSDLFLASGGVINFNNGDVTLTHGSNMLTLGGGELAVASAANSQALNIKTATTTVTCSSGSTVTATNLIPAGSMVVGVTTRVTTLMTGATSYSIGDGTDADRWGATISPALNTTSGIADFTIASPVYYAAATSVVLTAAGSDFTAGVVRITVHYINLTVAAS